MKYLVLAFVIAMIIAWAPFVISQARAHDDEGPHFGMGRGGIHFGIGGDEHRRRHDREHWRRHHIDRFDRHCWDEEDREYVACD